MIKLNKASLANRKTLWLALSDLFLDTKLQDSNLSFIALKMKESGYSLDEIKNILITEVLPACIPNLHCIAGEWAGFDEEWLYNKIITSPPTTPFKRWRYRRHFWMIRNDWQTLSRKYNAL